MKRYDASHSTSTEKRGVLFREYDDGTWVKFTDHEEEVKKLKEEIEELKLKDRLYTPIEMLDTNRAGYYYGMIAAAKIADNAKNHTQSYDGVTASVIAEAIRKAATTEGDGIHRQEEVKRAVAAEREACAGVADEEGCYESSDGSDHDKTWEAACIACSTAIRQR